MPMTPLKMDMLDEQTRPRDWDPPKISCKGPLRMARLCILGIFLPAALVAGPVYLRYRVYSEQLYPFAASDQRLIDGKVSTTWCQRQIIKVNTTFNAYLMKGEPKLKGETIPVSMIRHLVLEDDMKEYWGFYLLAGSSVTVSTCVRWPGASLTIIRGHKHLHECAFIGDDSSEELDELLEVAAQRGLLNGTGLLQINKDSNPSNEPHKMKRVRQGVHFHQSQRENTSLNTAAHAISNQFNSHELDANTMREILAKLFAKTLDTKIKQKENPHHHYEGVFRESTNIERPPVIPNNILQLLIPTTSTVPTVNKELNHTKNHTIQTSAEVFDEILEKISALGNRGGKVIKKLVDQLEQSEVETKNFTKLLNNIVMNSSLPLAEKRRLKRQLILSTPLASSLTNDEVDEDAAIEREDLHPDGIAEDRGSVNESTLNDRSNSEFWSSFSSSEERLLECKGLILNLPLVPHPLCKPKFEKQHTTASVANTITYRVPIDGYYFFVFNSENEVQTNYVRVQFDLLKTAYNTSDPVHACTNSTKECSLPFNFFSWERTILELPLTGNDSQWNEEYVVVSHCEPRTTIYLVCIITVPLLILFFAFH